MSLTAPRSRARIAARPIDEPHRASSQLELQFDLIFVVAIASITVQLAHDLAAVTRSTGWSRSCSPHHMAERYGLFTIILLGEGVLAASTGVRTATEDGGVSGSLVTISLAGLVLVFALWWLYFLHPAGEGLADRRHRAYRWGYGHYGVFAALAALGAGLEVAVAQAGHHVEASPMAIGYAIAIPVSVFLVLLWAVHAPIVSSPAIAPALLLSAAATKGTT